MMRLGLTERIGTRLALVSMPLAANSASDQHNNAGPRQFAKDYIAAIDSQDVEKIKALWHPASRVCLKDANRPFYDRMLARELENGPALVRIT